MEARVFYLLSHPVGWMLLCAALLLILGFGCMLWVRQSRQQKFLKQLERDAAWLQEVSEREEDGPAPLALMHHLRQLDQSIRRRKGRLGLVRFNAAGDGAADMSFSLALLDDEQTGIIISSLFSHRGPSYFYAKPVEKGVSPYPLSAEEELAIQRAMDDGDGMESIPVSSGSNENDS